MEDHEVGCKNFTNESKAIRHEPSGQAAICPAAQALGAGATGVSTRHGAIIQKDDGKSVDVILGRRIMWQYNQAKRDKNTT